MANWIIFARAGAQPWPYRNGFFPQEYSQKKFANQCKAVAEESGAIFCEIVAAGKFKLDVSELKQHLVVRCERDSTLWVVKPTPFAEMPFNIDGITCPTCGRHYIKEDNIYTSDRPLTILHNPEW